ncbi:MAG TPA: peptide chain release factor N(5)-glutamine methyltransferase [Thermoanaerobaculia bacterium]|nr:peptide chain release factor N(5)-glutamine methyltransferase [Thermoanaerobaculia bacterium]
MPRACSGAPPSASTEPGARATTTAGELRARARRELVAAGRELDGREATMLLARVLGCGEAALLAHPEAPVSATDEACFLALLERRLAGEPFAYLVGEREFYGRDFAVDRRVLIPRPETEHLVQAVLDLAPPRALVADIGTGSGCIALTLALERHDLRVVATDRSLPALRVAASNRRRHGLEDRVALLAGDLCDGLALSRFDVVASNPPYVDHEQRESLQVEVRDHEPPGALFAAEGGLACYRRLLDARARRAPGSLLVVEIGAGQLEALRALALPAFELESVVHDYGGVPRVMALRQRSLG